MNPHVAVVVLNWNGWQDTLPCLDSLAHQAYQNTSIIVVDNASTDGSRDRIAAWPDNSGKHWVRRQFVGDANTPMADQVDTLGHGDFVYLQSDINGGFAAGNNLGIRLALACRSVYVWILNNDTEVHHRALDALVNCAEKDNSIGMCGSLLVYHDARDQLQACGGVIFDYWRAMGKQLGHGLNPKSNEINAILGAPLSYIAGASLLARSEMILEVGAFEEKYFLYFEEIDWAERARNWKMAVAADSVVYHKEGASIGTASRGRRSVMSQYYLNRNVILFYARFHQLLLPMAILRVIRELLHQIKKRDGPMCAATWLALSHGITQRSGKVELKIS